MSVLFRYCSAVTGFKRLAEALDNGLSARVAGFLSLPFHADFNDCALTMHQPH